MADQPEATRTILDSQQMRRIIRRMAGEVLERNPDIDDLLLVGIRTRGVPLAEKIADEIEKMEDQRVPIGILDITLYRDDLSTIAPNPVVKETRLPGNLDGKNVVLCDDVLYTGRTIRAALDALADFGRPRRVQLAVLIDRGERELPIQAEVVGRSVVVGKDGQVEVQFEATDGEERVLAKKRGSAL